MTEIDLESEIRVLYLTMPIMDSVYPHSLEDVIPKGNNYISCTRMMEQKLLKSELKKEFDIILPE